MKRVFFALLIGVALLISATACSSSSVDSMHSSNKQEVKLEKGSTNKNDNHLLAEDIKYFKKQLPKLHKNPFSVISKDEFNEMTDHLIDRINQLNDKQVLVGLNQIVASIGDAHTSINIYDGYLFPLEFWVFSGKVYVVNADTSLEDMMYSQILKINGINIDKVIKQLTSLISHENDSWVVAMLPNYLQAPIYMYGKGIIKNENEAVFTVLKDGKEKNFTVSSLKHGKKANYMNTKKEDILVGKYDKNYDYEYLANQKALYFKYNSCFDMQNLKFIDFNKDMFDVIEKNDVDKVIIDLRNNNGGDSRILNPFTDRLKSYIAENSNVKIYILIGRNTFSSAMFAIYGIKEAAPEAIFVGEPTGGAPDHYGNVKSFKLPNTHVPIYYSTMFYEFTKLYHYKNASGRSFLPDVSIQPTINDYKDGTDVVLNYVLTN